MAQSYTFLILYIVITITCSQYSNLKRCDVDYDNGKYYNCTHSMIVDSDLKVGRLEGDKCERCNPGMKYALEYTNKKRKLEICVETEFQEDVSFKKDVEICEDLTVKGKLIANLSQCEERCEESQLYIRKNICNISATVCSAECDIGDTVVDVSCARSSDLIILSGVTTDNNIGNCVYNVVGEIKTTSVICLNGDTIYTGCKTKDIQTLYTKNIYCPGAESCPKSCIPGDTLIDVTCDSSFPDGIRDLINDGFTGTCSAVYTSNLNVTILCLPGDGTFATNCDSCVHEKIYPKEKFCNNTETCTISCDGTDHIIDLSCNITDSNQFLDELITNSTTGECETFTPGDIVARIFCVPNEGKIITDLETCEKCERKKIFTVSKTEYMPFGLESRMITLECPEDSVILSLSGSQDPIDFTYIHSILGETYLHDDRTGSCVILKLSSTDVFFTCWAKCMPNEGSFASTCC